MCVLQANATAATHNARAFSTSVSGCMFVCVFEVTCRCHEWPSCFGHIKFSGVEREASLSCVHKSTGCVNGRVGAAIESLEHVMRNDAHTHTEKEGMLPTILCHQHLPRDFSSLSLYQQPSQSAAREKINFLLPDYIIRLRLECQLNIPHQHFIIQGTA